MVFNGSTWQRLTPRLVDHNYPAMSFMTHEGFRYFLPAVLCHSLRPGSMIDPLFHWVHTVLDPSPYREANRERIAIFSTDERTRPILYTTLKTVFPA